MSTICSQKGSSTSRINLNRLPCFYLPYSLNPLVIIYVLLLIFLLFKKKFALLRQEAIFEASLLFLRTIRLHRTMLYINAVLYIRNKLAVVRTKNLIIQVLP